MAIQGPAERDSKALDYDQLTRDTASFRLLMVLAKRSRHGYVQCEMFQTTTELMENAYTCLSYVWGTSNGLFKGTIIVNGKEVQIHQNLYDFLQVAHRKYVGEPFWIDALCIDQSNVHERNHQVSQMGDIYLRAKQVVAWLGPCDSQAFNPLSSLRSQISFPEPHAAPVPERASSQPGSKALWDIGRHWKGASRRGFIIGPVSTRFSTADSSDFSKPNQPVDVEPELRIRFLNAIRLYWSRAWITQELAVAHRVLLLFGQQELDLAVTGENALVNALELELRLAGNATDHPVYGIWRLANDMRWRTGEANTGADAISSPRDMPSLLTLLTQFRTKQCFYARDRIYSLRYLCNEGQSLEVDYDSSEIDLLRHIIHISQKPLCLCSALALCKALSTGFSNRIRRIDRLQTMFLEFSHIPSVPTFAPGRSCESCGVDFRNKTDEIVCLRTLCPSSSGHLTLCPHTDFEYTVRYWGLVTTYGGTKLPTSTASLVQHVEDQGEASIVVRLSVRDLQNMSPMIEHDLGTPGSDMCFSTYKFRFVDTSGDQNVYI